MSNDEKSSLNLVCALLLDEEGAVFLGIILSIILLLYAVNVVVSAANAPPPAWAPIAIIVD